MLGVDSITRARWQRELNQQTAAERRQRALAKMIESNTVTVEPDSGRDTSNLLAQLGRPLSAYEIMRKLKKCNPQFHFEYSKSDPSKIGIYLRDKKRLETGSFQEVLTFICGMEAQISPEFTVIHKKKKKVPNQDLFGNKTPTRDVNWQEIETYADQTRGWRTILVRLLHAGLITRLDVEKNFGWAPSQSSENWHNQTA